MGYTQILKEINGELFENCGEILVTRHHDKFAFACYHCEEPNIYMDLTDFVNHMQSQHISCLEKVSLIDDDNDDIDVGDFVPGIKEPTDETEYIDDDFDTELTEEYIEDDYDAKPQEEATELSDNDDIKMIYHEAKASPAASTVDVEVNDIKTSLFNIDFVGNKASSTTPTTAPHTKKHSTLESKKALGRQVQKPPVLIAPKPPATATLSAMGGINLSPDLKATLNSRRIIIAQPKALFKVQSTETKQLMPKIEDTDEGEFHSTFYDLQFIDKGIMPPEPEIEEPNTYTSEPAANPDVPKTQVHAGKSVMLDKKSESRVVSLSAVGQNKMRISYPGRLPDNANASQENLVPAKKRVQVIAIGKPPRQIFQQSSSSIAHRSGEQKIIRENSPNEVYVKIDHDDDALSSDVTYDKLMTEAQSPTSTGQRLIVSKRIACVPIAHISAPTIEEVGSTTESQNDDLLEFIAHKPSSKKAVVRLKTPRKKRRTSSEPSLPENKAGLDAYNVPLSPMKRNIIIRKRITLPNNRPNPRKFKLKPGDIAPKVTLRPFKSRGRPRVQSPILIEDNTDESEVVVKNSTKSVNKKANKKFVILKTRGTTRNEETGETTEEATNEVTAESPSTGMTRRSNRTVKQFVKYNQ